MLPAAAADATASDTRRAATDRRHRAAVDLLLERGTAMLRADRARALLRTV